MNKTLFLTFPAVAAALLAACPIVRAEDMTMWGMTPYRNMVSNEKHPPVDWDVKTGKNIKWSAKLGSKAYGNPVVTNGMVFVGTNNEGKYDPRYTNPDGTAIDGGVLLCFDEQTGKFLWQRYSPKLPAGRVNDWPGEGLCSTVYAESNRIWFCTNRCEVVCAEVSPKGCQDVWVVNMMTQLGVFPHNMTSSSIASWGDYIYVITGNGVDDNHKTVVAPQAPGIVCFNKGDGKVIWTSNVAGSNVLHGQWSSVAIVEVNGRPLVIAPLGDGIVYAFDARDGKIIWRFDSNPKNSIYPQTRNELIATPVINDNKMYIANGQDPEHSTGYAHFWCVDITREGDISAESPSPAESSAKPQPGQELMASATRVPSRKGLPNPNSGVVWHFFAEETPSGVKPAEDKRMHRSISTAAVYNGLVFEPDFSGFVHCFDANTGKQYWAFDTESEIWGSPLICDGKLYVGTGDEKVYILEASKEAKDPIAVHEMGHPVYGTPVMANGTMFILSMNRLYAIQQKQ